MAGYNFATEEGIRRVIDMVRRLERQIYNLASGRRGSSSSPNELWCSYKNTATDSVPGNGVIVLDDLELISDGADRAYEASKPSTTFSRIFAASHPFSVASNKHGLCKFTGELELLYDHTTGTPAFGETWGPKPGQYSLAKNYPGFSCRGIKDSTNHIMLATREEITHLVGKADSNIAAQSSDIPGSGTVSVYFRTGGSGAYADSGINITGYNLSDAEVTASKLIQLKLVAGDWLVDFEGCS